MPLSEFLRMARRKFDSDQQKPSQTVFSSRGEDDLVELVWENGQIMMQGQSSRPARNPTLQNSPKFRDSRTEKLGDVESMLNDLSPVVPSGDLDLSQDDEMVPWLNYQVEDTLPNYCNEFLPEISGVTGNGQNSFVSPDKKSSCDQNKARLACSWPPQLGQAPDPSIVSGVSDIVSNNTGKGMVNNSMVTKEMQNNMGMASNSSNFLNFSHFSRPGGTLVKSNLPIGDGLPASVKDNSAKSRFVDQLNATPKEFDFHGPSSSKTSPAERTENVCRENSIKNDKPPLVRNSNGDPSKGVGDGERSLEPMMASSSVGSGNSGDRISCEQTHNSKRKFHDIEESEGHGDDIETESVGLKKPASGRGGGGSKRGRAAEVHNLSERRRRDRINEKMRALQELIPNCNKADKASMLDEAIEYLKTLQLQVQMMSMGAGLCMPPMMFPPGIHPAHLPHFSHMGVGMGLGMGMGYGMGMADMNAGSSQFPMYPAPPMQGTHFPSPMSGAVNFQRLPTPMYGHHPSQGIPTSVPLAPMVSSTVRAPVTSAIDSSAFQTRTRGEASGSANPNLLQATNEVTDKSAAVRENKQVTDVIGTHALTPTKSIDISKVDGGD